MVCPNLAQVRHTPSHFAAWTADSSFYDRIHTSSDIPAIQADFGTNGTDP
jgi:hypothetical protein